MHSGSGTRRLQKEGSGNALLQAAALSDSSSSDEERNAKVAASSSSSSALRSAGFSSQSQSSRASKPVAKAAAHEGLHRSYTYSHHPQEPSGVSRQDHSPHQSHSHSQSQVARHGNAIRRRTKITGSDRGAAAAAAAAAGVLRHGSNDADSDDNSTHSVSSLNSNAKVERASKAFHSEAADNLSSDGENNRMYGRGGGGIGIGISARAGAGAGTIAGKQQGRARRRISSSSDFGPSYGSNASAAAAEKEKEKERASPFDAAVVGISAMSDHGLSERRGAAKLPDDSPADADAKSVYGDSQFKGRALQGVNRR